MSPESLFGWILGAFITLAMADIVAYVNLRDRIHDQNILLAQRVSRLEAVMEILGTKTAKVLHSPDDHLGIDDLLDKYLDRHYELSFDEWKELLTAMDKIENDRTLPTGARLAAATLSAVCHHKLMMDPTMNRWWKDLPIHGELGGTELK